MPQKTKKAAQAKMNAYEAQVRTALCESRGISRYLTRPQADTMRPQFAG